MSIFKELFQSFYNALKLFRCTTNSGDPNYIAPYTETSASESNVIWVTAAPMIQNFCRQYVTSISGQQDIQSKLDLRLKQRLGLNPDWQYDVFVELWVSPADLFRPCVDPSPDDTACDLAFGATNPTVRNIADYRNFFTNIYCNDFRYAPGVPWTGLGYTYDWGNAANRQGESEFVLSPSTPYIIEQAVPTMEYCTGP